MPETITVEIADRIARVTLNRPEVRNAFNGVMVGELNGTFRALRRNAEVRVIVLTGAGKAFCAGADLNWMRSVLDGTFEDNLEEARLLADTLDVMNRLPQPLVGRIPGPAMGGGVGLASVCDLSVASTEAFFALSEARVGLTPATISPYVIRRVGLTFAREMFLTSRRVGAEEARVVGLVNRVAPPGELDGSVEGILDQLLLAAPGALKACKDLLRHAAGMGRVEANEWTAHQIARRRQSAEGQEGMAAFIEKRKPSWQSEEKS
jgi:methylglutaconyl-CoA hydratase